MEEFDKYYLKAVTFLSYRPRSVKEVKDNLEKTLAKKKFPEDILTEHRKYIPLVIEKLLEQKFLNDTQFATWWIEQRSRNKPKSKMVLKMELKQKGIPSDIIEAVMAQEDIQTIADDYTQAKQLVQKKIYKYRELPRIEIYKKLGGFLGRRGFSWEIAKRSIDEILDDGV